MQTNSITFDRYEECFGKDRVYLQELVKSYEIFWKEWSQSDYFNLPAEQKNLIDRLVGLNGDAIEKALEMISRSTLLTTIKHLECSFTLYREFVVTTFLRSLIDLAKHLNMELERFILTPIHALPIPNKLTNALARFGFGSIGLLFTALNVNTFSSNDFYPLVCDFVVVYRDLYNLK